MIEDVQKRAKTLSVSPQKSLSMSWLRNEVASLPSKFFIKKKKKKTSSTKKAFVSGSGSSVGTQLNKWQWDTSYA